MRKPGPCSLSTGRFIPDDFDDPLDEELLRAAGGTAQWPS